MGLFDSILGGNSAPVTFNKEEAFWGLVVAVTAIDGSISDEEVDDLIKFSNRTNLLSGIRGQSFNNMNDKIFKVLKKDGVQKLVDTCVAALPSEYAASTFAVCADLIYSDGSVDRDEQVFLEMLMTKLNIDSGLAMKIVEVISLKNKI
jgi:sensor domain CHASE-containing protein